MSYCKGWLKMKEAVIDVLVEFLNFPKRYPVLTMSQIIKKFAELVNTSSEVSFDEMNNLLILISASLVEVPTEGYNVKIVK